LKTGGEKWSQWPGLVDKERLTDLKYRLFKNDSRQHFHYFYELSNTPLLTFLLTVGVAVSAI